MKRWSSRRSVLRCTLQTRVDPLGGAVGAAFFGTRCQEMVEVMGTREAEGS
jgi:hypothetical protein